MKIVKEALGCLWAIFCLFIFIIIILLLIIFVLLSPPDEKHSEYRSVEHKVETVVQYDVGDMSYILDNTNQKPTVVLNLKRPMIYGTEVAIKVFNAYMGDDYVPTITSGNDSEHSSNSKHYEDLAVDFRIKDVPYDLRMSLYTDLNNSLQDYLVLWEDIDYANEHIHIQYIKQELIMFLLTTYTTDREDLDLIPTVLLAKKDTREEIVEEFISEILDTVANHNLTNHTVKIFSNNFDDELDTLNYKQDNRIGAVKKFLKKQLSDNTVNCISVKVDYGYEDVYTILNV